ncbi:MAG: hypothetical protein P8Z36_05145 [Gemmatimonadota bacterium]|jgi:hypothetical protein
MDQLVVVPYPRRITLEARSIEHNELREGAVGLAYYYHGNVVARSAVSEEAVGTIHALLKEPVSVALAAQEDDDGNIEARFCLVLPMDRDTPAAMDEEEEEEDEPWKASVPQPPPEIESDYAVDEENERPQFALLPIGNVVRSADDRHHGNVAGDAREMLDNLLAGRAKDAVQKAIDDLLDSI